ncbi:hypothetical protein [Rufibacter soli]
MEHSAEEIEKARLQYQKLKGKNKTLFKQGCIESHEQELTELQEQHRPDLIDFYYDSHMGVWVLKTIDNMEGDEFETKYDLLDHVVNGATIY